MNLFLIEQKKIINSKALWVLAALCLILNMVSIFTNPGNEYTRYIAETSKKTGFILGEIYNSNLEQIPANEEQSLYKSKLKHDTANIVEVFDGYDSNKIADAYISFYGLTGNVADTMNTKYANLQKAIDKKAEINESMTLYFASATFDYHNFLFGDVMKSLLTEGLLIAVLVAFLSIGYEHVNHTEACVYSTKTGRRILCPKIAASLSIGIITYVALSLITLTVYFSTIHYGNTFGSSVSSAFNFIVDDVIGVRPFTTWHSFTIRSYLLAVLVISSGLVACFALMSLVISMFIRNCYTGFLVLVIVNLWVLIWEWKSDGITQYGNYIFNLTPIKLYHLQPLWFTDGGSSILWKNFETLGSCGSLIILTVLCFAAVKSFERRDIL